MNKLILLSGLAILLASACFAQDPRRKDLEKQRASIQKEIDDVKRSLNATAKNKKQTIGQLSLIQKKLSLREAQIQTINQQIDLIQEDIVHSSRDAIKLHNELDTLKMQYQESIVYAYKNRSNYSLLNFLFSSTGFNDAFRRISYLRSYRRYREQQAENINNTQMLLKDKIADLNKNRSMKKDVLLEQNKQHSMLEEEKQEKNAAVLKLKSREKELNRQLTTKKGQDIKLKAAIAAVIRREIAEAKKRKAAIANKPKAKVLASAKAAPKPVPGKAVAILNDDPAFMKLSGDFESEKRNLPWPVSAGRVSMAFGLQKVEGVRDLWYDNPGITIETYEGKPVKAVFNGEVSAVFEVGSGKGIILKHGGYLTTYSNILSVRFSKGQKVKAGDIIGLAAAQNDGTVEVEFVITNEKGDNLDPEKWLRKK